MFQIVVSFQKFKKILYFIILLSLLYKISHSDLAWLRKKLSNKFFDLLIDDLIGNAEHFETGADWAVNQKLELDQLEPFQLIEIEDIE